jgi:hypothetical protein
MEGDWPANFFERDVRGYRPSATFLLEEPLAPIEIGWALVPKVGKKKGVLKTYLFPFATEPAFDAEMRTWLSLGKPEDYPIYFSLGQDANFSFQLNGTTVVNARGEEIHEGQLFNLIMNENTGKIGPVLAGNYGAKIYHAANPDETVFR